MRGFETNSHASVPDSPPGGGEPGIQTPDAERDTYPRDRCWLDWYEDCHSETYHCPAAILERWNSLPNRKRREIAPKAWHRVRCDLSGRRSVEQAVSATRLEEVT